MISKKQFITGKFPEIKNKANVHPILLFLRKNKAHAYSVSEIVKATKMKDTAIRSMLRKLRKKGVVAHKSPYFIAK